MQHFFKPYHYAVVHTRAISIEQDSSSRGISDQREFSISRLSGIFFSESVQYSGDFTSNWPHAVSLDDAADAMGEWSAVAERRSGNGNEVVALSDAYGYSPLFYALIPGQAVLLSDSFGGISAGLESLDIRRSLDLANYAVVMPNWVGGFIGPFSNRTMANEIKILSVDECLHIGDKFARKVDRSKIGNSARIDCASDAIESGIQLSASILATLARNDELDHRLRLSGGGDSRMILAILAAAGLQHHFTVQATDPRGLSGYSYRVFNRDIQISDELRRMFGMSWAVEKPTQTFTIDFRESLAHFLGYRSNVAYDFSPGVSRSIPTLPLLTLIGGGGEILRASKGAHEYAVQSAPTVPPPRVGSPEEDELVADWLLGKLSIGEQLRGRAHRLVAESFSRTSGGSLWERFNHNYFLARNRSHFGHARYSQSENILVFHALSSPYFLRAARLTPFEMRAEESLMENILKQTAPKLLDIEFADEPVTDAVCSPGFVRVPASDRWEAGFDAVRSVDPVQEALTSFGGGRHAPSRFNAKQTSENYAKLVFASLEREVSVESAEMVGEQNDRLLRAMKSGKLNSNQLAGKAASAMEVYFPAGSPSSRIEYDCTDRPRRQISQRVAIDVPSTRNDRWNGLPVVDISPIITYSKGVLNVDLKPSYSEDSHYEFACYILRDSIVELKYSYQPDCHFDVQGPVAPGIYSAIGFARLRGTRKPMSQKDSASIHVGDLGVLGCDLASAP